MPANDRITDIRTQLETVVSELTNESLEILRAAVERGETKRPDSDKKVLQARRAVEKAVRALDGID